jgi:hypothetical protein
VAISTCQVFSANPTSIVGRIQVDSVVSGNDHLTMEYSTVGPLGPWTLDETTGGLSNATPYFVPDAVGGFTANTHVWIRWRQYDSNNVQVDEAICDGFTAGPLPPSPLTGEICCGLAVRENWDDEDYGYGGGGYGQSFHNCVPPGVNDWTPLGP